MLDPTDHELIKQAIEAQATFVTWDRVVRKAGGGLSPYEVMDAAISEGSGTSLDTSELGRLRQLSPKELTSLAQDANETYKHFLHNIVFTKKTARLIRYLRVTKDYSWRAVASFCSDQWDGDWESNQLAGMVICEKAAEMLGENFMEPPWN